MNGKLTTVVIYTKGNKIKKAIKKAIYKVMKRNKKVN